MSEDPAEWWDEAYEGEPPWDTGRPQPGIVDAAERGLVRARVLDVGCGTGTHACHFAARGHPVVGIDFSAAAIERAREKARERDLDVAFRVGNALDLPADLGPFETIVDSGLFHAFDADRRAAYADELANLVPSGGRVVAVGFREGAPEDGGPNPVSAGDVRRAFDDGWTVESFEETPFETTGREMPGFLAVLKRV